MDDATSGAQGTVSKTRWSNAEVFEDYKMYIGEVAPGQEILMVMFLCAIWWPCLKIGLQSE